MGSRRISSRPVSMRETSRSSRMSEGDIEVLLGRGQVVLGDQRLGQLGVALDGGDRRPQLVRGDGEELVLEAGKILHLPTRLHLLGVELGVLVGQGRALGKHLRQRQLVVGHGPLRVVGGDDQRPEHLPART
jgi:hypothetical protein